MSDAPRTSTPTDRFGEEYGRFGGRLDADHEDLSECDECDGRHFDFWMREGATAGVVLCVGCGRTCYEWKASGGLEEVSADD
jgi:hypothetical protein